MNADELLKILSKQWCNTNDLIKITGLCKNNVLKLKKEIMSHLKGKNYSLGLRVYNHKECFYILIFFGLYILF